LSDYLFRRGLKILFGFKRLLSLRFIEVKKDPMSLTIISFSFISNGISPSIEEMKLLNYSGVTPESKKNFTGTLWFLLRVFLKK